MALALPLLVAAASASSGCTGSSTARRATTRPPADDAAVLRRRRAIRTQAPDAASRQDVVALREIPGVAARRRRTSCPPSAATAAGRSRSTGARTRIRRTRRASTTAWSRPAFRHVEHADPHGPALHRRGSRGRSRSPSSRSRWRGGSGPTGPDRPPHQSRHRRGMTVVGVCGDSFTTGSSAATARRSIGRWRRRRPSHGARGAHRRRPARSPPTRAAVRAVDPAQPVFDLLTMRDAAKERTLGLQYVGAIMIVFGASRWCSRSSASTG